MILAKHFSTLRPTTLLISLPRSGSSWVGAILGSARNGLYLREPITQSYLALENKLSVFDVDPSNPPQAYQYFANLAFCGLPLFSPGIVRKPEQWSLAQRHYRRLVIKEVNPLACEWLISVYKPRVIFLVRHPAAVALSYAKLGWNEIKLRERLTSKRDLLDGLLNPWKEYLLSLSHESNFWEQHGAMQGAVLRIAFGALESYPDYRVVFYEDLCMNPLKKFQELIEFAGLDWDSGVEKLIQDSMKNGDKKQPYNIFRNSRRMIQSWHNKVSRGDLKRLKNGFDRFELPLYRSSNEWPGI